MYVRTPVSVYSQCRVYIQAKQTECDKRSIVKLRALSHVLVNSWTGLRKVKRGP